jgi:Fe2+ transport system protein B
MQKTNLFFALMFLFSLLRCAESKSSTHLDKISKHLFYIKPDYSMLDDDPVDNNTKVDTKKEMELLDVVDSEDEASSAIDETELSKALAAKCGAQSSVSNLDIAHLKQVLILTEELKKAHAEFMRRITKKEKARTKKCIELIDSLALYDNDPQFKAKEFVEFRAEFEKKYPAKFMQMKSLANQCGLQSVHDKLSKKIGALKEASPLASNVLTTVLKEKKLHTIGELIRFAKPVSDD